MKFRSYDIEIIDDPENSIKQDLKEKFIDELTIIAQDAFAKPNIPTREDVKNHILPVSTLVLAKDGDTGIGFSTTTSFNVSSEPVLSLVGVAVKQDYQRGGVGSFLISAGFVLESQKAKFSHGYIMSRTQSPVVFKTLKDLYPQLYPQPGEPVPEEIAQVAANAVLKSYGKSLFDKKTFVFPRAYWNEDERKRCESCGIPYDAAMYTEIPRCSNKEINSWLDCLLNYKAGDAMIVLGKADKKVLREALSKACAKSPANSRELENDIAYYYDGLCQYSDGN